MKQVQQNYRSGELKVAEVPAPRAGEGEVLVATRVSLISSGTERQLMQLAKASLVGKAAARPDLVRRVISNVRKEGLKPTLEKVFAKLDSPIPLGYSLVGEIVAMGRNVAGHSLGDRVACAGAGLANHAEFNAVPKNLTVAVPANVDDEDASFVTLGAIALQGVRLAEPTLGEVFVVTGLGLIGLIAVQLLRANGCKVLGVDTDPARLALARGFGAETADLSKGEDPESIAGALSKGRGVDGVLLTLASKSSEPVAQAARMCRQRGRIVLVGVTGLELNRGDF